MNHLILHHTSGVLEVGTDEAGRGPLIGRVYAGAVVWPQDLTSPLVKDSKKYSNSAEREVAYDFIVENAIAYGIAYVEPEDIDEINIFRAVMNAMHSAIDDTNLSPQHIIVDGNSFRPYTDPNGQSIAFTTVIGGDNTYYSIAAASVLAKVEHDRYIRQLCDQHPLLERYDLRNNMGYGTPKHFKAIAEYGVSQFHRRSFKPCQHVPIIHV